MTETMLQRLLRHPHAAVFDKSPDTLMAFALRHTNGAQWTVADRVLTVTNGNNPATKQAIDLNGKTLADVRTNLIALGYYVPPQPRPTASAMALVEGSGDQANTNGDLLGLYTSLLWSILGGYAGELNAADYQRVQALKQMVITQAEDEWLDLWGTLYATPRKVGESDASLAARIPQEAFRLRGNAHAIELAVFAETGKLIKVEEPWMDIFVLDESTLSGISKFYDGETIGYHLIRPTSESIIDWNDVLPVIERNKAAGVLVLTPKVGSVLSLSAEYSGQYWLGAKTWAKAGTSWKDFNAVASTVRIDSVLFNTDSVNLSGYPVGFINTVYP